MLKYEQIISMYRYIYMGLNYYVPYNIFLYIKTFFTFNV